MLNYRAVWHFSLTHLWLIHMTLLQTRRYLFENFWNILLVVQRALEREGLQLITAGFQYCLCYLLVYEMKNIETPLSLSFIICEIEMSLVVNVNQSKM